jgi:hypothetical protein
VKQKKPTARQLETTLDVLAWFSTTGQEGRVRDNIGEIRSLLDDVLEEGW